MTLSERLMVESRWAMEIVVLLPFRRAARAWLTNVSDSASRADVAVRDNVSMIGVAWMGRKMVIYLRQGLGCLGS